MGGAAGCQWTGDRAAAASEETMSAPGRQYPPSFLTPSAQANNGAPAAAETASIASGPSTPTPASSELVQVAHQSGADAPDTEEKNNADQDPPGTASRAAGVAAAPVADNAADEDEDKRKERKDRAGKSEKDKGYQVDLSLPSPAKGMATPTIPAPQKVQPLTLGDALAQAGVANPVIALAQQAVLVSRAEQLQARVLLVPNINVGSSFDTHTGPVQASFGAIRKISRNAVLYGLGVNTVAAETIKIPGLFINTPLTEAFFSPLIARQVVANRGFTATATRNEVLLDVSTAYLALLESEGRLAVIRQSEADFNEVVRLTADYAKTGLGREGDANRARSDLLNLQYTEQEAQEQVAIAAANLARLLNLDPSVRLQTGDVPIQIVTFIDPKMPLPKLLDIAANNRPELMAAAANIRASQIRVHEEKSRPFIPTLWAGFSADDFGGGAVASTNGNVPNPHGEPSPGGSPRPDTGGQTVPKFGRITGRTDVDVIAFWTLQNFGLGNLAHIKQRRAELGEAEAERVRVLNQVGLEVSEAYNTAAQQYLSISIERRRVREASDGFQRDLNLIRAGGALPIEVLNQAKRLFSARQDLLAAVIGFDRAQFQLFVALGQPPTLAVDEGPPPPAMPEKKQ
jgi:outer membrane protein TolC